MSLSRDILATLGESPLPVSTPDLVAIVATGLTHPRQRVWATLRELERDGLVRKGRGTVRGERKNRGYAVATWRLT